MSPTKKLTSAQAFESDSVEVPEFRIDALPPAERERAVLIAQGARLLMLKALLNREAPAAFRMTQDPTSFEGRAMRMAGELSPSTLARLGVKALATDPARIAALLGPAADMDLTQPISDDRLQQRFRFPFVDEKTPSKSSAANGPKFSRVFLNLRKLHCVDETNPEGGGDDMVLGGILVGPSGATKAISSFVAGTFDDKTVQDYGSIPLGSASLKVTPGYPKNVYCIFLLVESDSDDKEVAAVVSQVCSFVGTIAAAVGQPIVAAVAGAAAELIDAFAGLIDEDEFPPYGIELRLNSENQFGSSGQDKKRHTGNIKGHGGTYRIGFRWELVA